MTQPVFRFAPSPNGRLHLGHAYSALLNETMAREAEGRMLLRIEDTDVTRCKPELTQHVLDDLRWLEFRWEEPVRVQSRHFDDYENALQKLWFKDAIYPCFCSRKSVAEHALSTRDPDGARHYGGTCRNISKSVAQARISGGEQFGWRLITRNSAADAWGDVMIAKPRAGSCYHIAVVVDDALQGVTHVVRGRDIEAATSIHTFLQQLLDLPHPHYHHHDLIEDGSGRKLSKQLKSQSLGELRAQGVTVGDIRKQLGLVKV
jgi:glutamyl-Q tRNA(Asp) synthetase